MNKTILLRIRLAQYLCLPTQKKISFNVLYVFILFFLGINFSNAATITSAATVGNWSTSSTWVGGVVPSSADTVIISSGASITLTSNVSVANITINSGGILKAVNRTLTISNAFVNSGQFTATTGRLTLSGTTGSFNNLGSLTMGSGRLSLSGNLLNSGAHTLTGTEVRFTGNGTQSIAGFVTTGLVSSRKNGGSATFVGNVNGGAFTINNSTSIALNLGSSLTHTFSGIVMFSKGILNGNSSTLVVNVVSNSAWRGKGNLFTAGTSTVIFSGNGNQTLANTTATTFNNLIFSNSGTKSLTTSRCIVNGVLTMEGNAIVSAAPTYGSNSTLKYNRVLARIAGVEWVTPFTGIGGVQITNSGAITLNNAKVFNASVPLNIATGSTLNTANLQLTFGGNFANNGTFTAGSSPILINNSMVSQNISGFSTTGLVTMSKTAGVATLAGNVNGSSLIINGSGAGTLNLGTSLTHTFSGTVTLTSGILNGGSSSLTINGISATAWSGNGSVFSAGFGTVNFGGAGNQTLSATSTTFNNLTFSNSGIKSLTTANCICNGVVSMEGTATVSATPTFGTNAILRYNTSTSRIAGVEWVTPFTGLGGVIISNTGAITMNNAKVFNASVPLNINSGSSLATANFQVAFGGNFINNGSFIAGSSPILINNSMASQSISGFSTTGLVSMTKNSGVATFTGNTSGSGLTINGSGGTLNLGTTLIHTYATNLTSTSGTLNGGSSVLKIGGAWVGTGAAFIANTGTIEYNGSSQNIATQTYYNLTLSGTGTKTFITNTTGTNSLSVSSGVVANLATGLTHTFSGLLFNGVTQISGSWGGVGSSATNINATYFTATTGKINNNCSLPTIVNQPIAPIATCSGSGTQTISVTATGAGLTYSWRKAGIAVSNGGVFSGQGTATLTLTNPMISDSGSYDVVVSGTCGTSVTSIAVNVVVNSVPIITSQPTALSLCETTSGSFTVATSAISPTYQWQYSTNPISTWTNTNGIVGMTGNNAPTLTYSNANVLYNNKYIRCVVTSTSGCVVYTNPVLLTVSFIPSVGAVSSNQAICNGSLPSNDVSISSASGTIQWQRADDALFSVNVSNIGTNSTVLSIGEVGVLNVTTYFRAIVSNGSCVDAISSSIIITIDSTSWTSAGGGSWSNGVPTSVMAATILYDFTSSGDLNACTLTVDNNAIVTILSGDSITLNGELNVLSGSLTLNNNANLIQSQDVANSGNIIIKRDSAPISRFDYTLWSSPVSGQKLQSFSPGTLANRFYSYNSGTDFYEVIASPSTTDFAEANGYLIRVTNYHPTTPTIWTGTFTGVPNNGNVDIAVTTDTYNAIGNPYPSPIDADAFITDNDLTEALYFWRKTNNAATSSYATYTLAGGVSNSAGDPLGLVPNGIIQVGQGFLAKSTSDTIIFTNSMRVGDTSNQFLRIAEEANRVWLNLTSDTGYFGQMMLAYMPEATNSYDSKIDGRYINDCQTALSSLINNEEFTIQGRELPFNVNDIVPLGFKSLLNGNYTISINNVDGLFADGQQIFLKDNLTNVVHNLSLGSYQFSSEAGIFNSRFEIVYQPVTLGTENSILNQNNVVITKQGQNISISTNSIDIKDVKVYDIQGRLIVEQNDINLTKTKLAVSATNQVLIVKVILKDNSIVTKKVIN